METLIFDQSERIHLMPPEQQAFDMANAWWIGEIKKNMYPRSQDVLDQKRTIDAYLDYVEMMVHRNQSRLTKLVIQKVHNERYGHSGLTEYEKFDL